MGVFLGTRKVVIFLVAVVGASVIVVVMIMRDDY